MADKMQKQKRPEIFFIKNDGGQYWDGRTWVDHEHKAEVFCGSSAVHSALVLMCSDDDRSAATVVPCLVNAAKACDQIRIQYHDDTFDMVPYSMLDRLIIERDQKYNTRLSHVFCLKSSVGNATRRMKSLKAQLLLFIRASEGQFSTAGMSPWFS